MLKLSIITVNLNNAEGLQKTIESVISQTFTDYEYIIIDGGSTDGSKDVIKKYADKITYWVSEPDKGIYNAMNKGIKVTKGEYCLFLNSGDNLIENNILNTVFENFPNKDIVYGNMQSPIGLYEYPKIITYSLFFFGSLGHPASFIKKTLFDTYGVYNEDNKIVSDWEFFIKTLMLNNHSYQHIPHTISYYELGGMSVSEKLRDIHVAERERVLKNAFPLMYDDYVEFGKIKQELNSYKNSRLIKVARKIQNSKLYKKIF